MARQNRKKRPVSVAAMGQKPKNFPSLIQGVLPAPPAPDDRIHKSEVALENIATGESPVYRRRIMLPLTPRAVREEQVAAGTVKRTPLDLLLTEPQAAALEAYAAAEDMLRGNARAQDYCGDRVQTARRDMAPLPDGAMEMLRIHAEWKRLLDTRTLAVLNLFCLQQWRDPLAKSDAQLGLEWCPRERNKAAAWRIVVAQAAKRLM